ncbi:MAG: hypothetical protein KF708_07135 [Pirellulales bacterium]|nr:hypothetical protein [Pirellulales bacterium]
MPREARRDLVHDLFLPTLLFAALGGMTWAVRGSSGYGATAGCIFAGVMWGAAWWFISRDPTSDAPTRRYTSAWIILAVTIGFGFSGARGWMQWPSFFEGRLFLAPNESVPISRGYGFLWLFIAGMPWAGLGACLLAWCGSLRETRAWHWVLRIGCGFGGGALAWYLYHAYPQHFLPLYDSLETQYHDLEHHNNLRRLVNDSRLAIAHLGIYLGLLSYELMHRDWKNSLLIATVGIVNGTGWALCQNWKWAATTWPGSNFNWWRCWESSGGISIGVALGLAYFLTNRRMGEAELATLRARRSIVGPNLEWLAVYLLLALVSVIAMLEAAGLWGMIYLGAMVLFGIAYVIVRRGTFDRETPALPGAPSDPTLERFGLYVGLLFGLGLSLRNGLKGWFNIYRGHEEYYSSLLWWILGPCFLVVLLALFWQALYRPLPRDQRGDLFPHAHGLMWLVLVVQNVLGQMITGPLHEWNEFAFNLYYVLLFLITAVIVVHYATREQEHSHVSTPRTPVAA